MSDENSIEKKYDYALATVNVSEVDAENRITTSAAHFTTQQAFVTFTLKRQGGELINATNLKIEAASNKLVTAKNYRGYGEKTYYYGSGYYTVDGGSGGYSDQDHGKLVDNDLGTKWCAEKPSGNWYVEFHTASAIRVDGYMLRTGDDSYSEHARNPKDWVLKGKLNPEDSWSIIDAKVDNYDLPAENNAPRDFDADAPGEYRYFRLEISGVKSGNKMQMSELRLFHYGSYKLTSSYGPITVTPYVAGSELTVALRNENEGADTYTLTATDGTDTFTFTKSGITFEPGKYYHVTVKMQSKVRALTLNWSKVRRKPGDPETLAVVGVIPADAADKSVTWRSSKESVATVDANGVVTGLSGGAATITATANDGSGVKASCDFIIHTRFDTQVIWDGSNCSYFDTDKPDHNVDGVDLAAGANSQAYWYDPFGFLFTTGTTGDTGFTFTTTLEDSGKPMKFHYIEISLQGTDGWDAASLGTGWSIIGHGGTYGYRIIWENPVSTPPTSVPLLAGVHDFGGANVTRIRFILI